MPTTFSAKILIAVVFLTSAGSLSAIDPPPPQLEIIRAGKFILTDPPVAAKLTAHLVELLESSSVNSTAHAVTNTTWTNLLASPSFIHVTFPTPREVLLVMKPGLGPRGRQPIVINEIAFPLPEGDWPPHVYVKIRTNIQAVCKFSPSALKRLTLHPALKLTNIAPYRELANLPEN